MPEKISPHLRISRFLVVCVDQTQHQQMSRVDSADVIYTYSPATCLTIGAVRQLHRLLRTNVGRLISY